MYLLSNYILFLYFSFMVSLAKISLTHLMHRRILRWKLNNEFILHVILIVSSFQINHGYYGRSQLVNAEYYIN
jgi:hypothetical protein